MLYLITVAMLGNVDGTEAVSRQYGRIVVLEPVRAPERRISEVYVPFYPQQNVDTLQIDDGAEGGKGANGDPNWKEAVKLPVDYESVKLLGLLYYPSNPWGGTPDLTAYVWDDNGSEGMPGDVLYGPQVFEDPPYDLWYYVDISAENITVDSGAVYVGWSDENYNPSDSTTLYWNWFDSAYNGYNYWYDGSSWTLDDFFGGDFMIRAVVEILSVNEGSASKPSASVVPGGLLFSVPSGKVKAEVVDIAGRVVFSGLVSGKAFVSLGRGVYFYRLGDLRGKALVK